MHLINANAIVTNLISFFDINNIYLYLLTYNNSLCKLGENMLFRMVLIIVVCKNVLDLVSSISKI